MSHWVDHGVVGFDEPARDEPVGDQFPPRRCSRVILAGNLSALDVELPEPAIDRLDRVSAIGLGFPLDFVGTSAEFVKGPGGARVGAHGRN
jgi:hypothetical protein